MRQIYLFFSAYCLFTAYFTINRDDNLRKKLFLPHLKSEIKLQMLPFILLQMASMKLKIHRKKLHYRLNTTLYWTCQVLGYLASSSITSEIIYQFLWSFMFSFLITQFHQSNKVMIDNGSIDII